MQASAEELLLLLKKWESESKQVVASGVIQPADGFGCAFKVAGLVRVDETAATFSIGELASSFTLCRISARDIGYLGGEAIDWAEWTDLIANPEQVEDLVVLRNPDLSTLLLCVMASP